MLTTLQYRTPLLGRPLPLPLAVLISATVALLGWRFSALTGGGAALATGIGTAILLGAGWPGAGALGAFFVGASVVSRLAPDPAAERLDAKGTRRDSGQVLANGGAAAAAALLAGPAASAVITASLAAAAADTWATAIGGWSRSWPRRLPDLARVPPGTSGGVTLLGTAGALLGAATVGLGAMLGGGESWLLPMAMAAGTAGMFADAILGGTLQGSFHCDACDQPTERRIHRCGAGSRRVRGLRWLDNDGVNALMTLLAAAGGWLWGR